MQVYILCKNASSVDIQFLVNIEGKFEIEKHSNIRFSSYVVLLIRLFHHALIFQQLSNLYFNTVINNNKIGSNKKILILPLFCCKFLITQIFVYYKALFIFKNTKDIFNKLIFRYLTSINAL